MRCTSYNKILGSALEVVTVTILYRVFSLQSKRVTCNAYYMSCHALHVHGLGADFGVGGPGEELQSNLCEA